MLQQRQAATTDKACVSPTHRTLQDCKAQTKPKQKKTIHTSFSVIFAYHYEYTL